MFRFRLCRAWKALKKSSADNALHVHAAVLPRRLTGNADPLALDDRTARLPLADTGLVEDFGVLHDFRGCIRTVFILQVRTMELEGTDSTVPSAEVLAFLLSYGLNESKLRFS